MTDVQVFNAASIFLFGLRTPAARAWVESNVSPDAQWYGDQLAVEHRYAADVAVGMVAAGLRVE